MSHLCLLLNKYEHVVCATLQPVCGENEARVFAKVRVADVVEIERSGITHEQYGYALKSHFDFVVTDKETKPLFVVEFDGRSHQASLQKHRDRLKNALCDRFDLPWLRVKATYLDRKYRGLDLLTYFVDCWFLNRAFGQAQQEGLIPWDEEFDPSLIWSAGNSKRWPYWLSLDLQLKIQHLHKRGLVRDPCLSHWVGVDTNGAYRCFSWMRISENAFVISATGMQRQRFPVFQTDLIEQLNTFGVFEKLQETLQGICLPATETVFTRSLADCRSKYQMLSFVGWAGYETLDPK